MGLCIVSFSNLLQLFQHMMHIYIVCLASNYSLISCSFLLDSNQSCRISPPLQFLIVAFLEWQQVSSAQQGLLRYLLSDANYLTGDTERASRFHLDREQPKESSGAVHVFFSWGVMSIPMKLISIHHACCS